MSATYLAMFREAFGPDPDFVRLSVPEGRMCLAGDRRRNHTEHRNDV